MFNLSSPKLFGKTSPPSSPKSAGLEKLSWEQKRSIVRHRSHDQRTNAHARVIVLPSHDTFHRYGNYYTVILSLTTLT